LAAVEAVGPGRGRGEAHNDRWRHWWGRAHISAHLGFWRQWGRGVVGGGGRRRCSRVSPELRGRGRSREALPRPYRAAAVGGEVAGGDGGAGRSKMTDGGYGER
jgi:hypothetical protein